MGSSQFVSEEVLHAFVDGETDAQTNAVVLAYLSTSPTDSARVETWRSQNELIRASFAKIEHEPIPLSLSLTPNRNPRTDALVQLIPTASSKPHAFETAAPPSKTVDLTRLCIALGIAFVGGMIAALVTPHITRPISDLFPTPPAFVTRTAAEMVLPSRTLEIAALRDKTLPAVESKTEDATTVQSSQNNLNPAPALVSDLAALELSLKGFQIGAASDPALCLFLRTRANEPLTLCQEPTPGQTGRPGISNFRLTKAPPLSAVDWAEKTGRFALAGGLSETAMLELSHRIHARFEASDQKP